MGITGLLPLLGEAMETTHLSALSGTRAAVDSYSWLHKGAYACAQQLVQGTPTDLFVVFCMRRVLLLRTHNITPVMVFDGCYLPSKAAKEDERKAKREEYRRRGVAFLRSGNRAQALDCFQKCVDVTPEMALQLIQACREIGIECIVAPYEADPQLAFLSRTHYVDWIFTEDSDLILFECRCIFFKLDAQGNGAAFRLESLRGNLGSAVSLANWPMAKIRQMGILAGCDYLESISGVGLKTAWKYLVDFGDARNAVSAMRRQGMAVPANYEQLFVQAELTFLHQLVWDPVNKKVVPLTPLPDGLDPASLHFAGPPLPADKTAGIVDGSINPLTLERIPLVGVLAPRVAATTGRYAMLAASSAKGDTGALPTVAQQRNTLDRYLHRAAAPMATAAPAGPNDDEEVAALGDASPLLWADTAEGAASDELSLRRPPTAPSTPFAARPLSSTGPASPGGRSDGAASVPLSRNPSAAGLLSGGGGGRGSPVAGRPRSAEASVDGRPTFYSMNGVALHRPPSTSGGGSSSKYFSRSSLHASSCSTDNDDAAADQGEGDEENAVVADLPLFGRGLSTAASVSTAPPLRRRLGSFGSSLSVSVSSGSRTVPSLPDLRQYVHAPNATAAPRRPSVVGSAPVAAAAAAADDDDDCDDGDDAPASVTDGSPAVPVFPAAVPRAVARGPAPLPAPRANPLSRPLASRGVGLHRLAPASTAPEPASLSLQQFARVVPAHLPAAQTWRKRRPESGVDAPAGDVTQAAKAAKLTVEAGPSSRTGGGGGGDDDDYDYRDLGHAGGNPASLQRDVENNPEIARFFRS